MMEKSSGNVETVANQIVNLYICLQKNSVSQKDLERLSSILVTKYGINFEIAELKKLIKICKDSKLINFKYNDNYSNIMKVQEYEGMYDEERKKIPIGVSNYKKLIEDHFYFVDKTSFIAQIIKNQAEVTLITRPRRFGKTLTMSMLYEFLRVDGDSTQLFKNTYIAKTSEYKQMNTYPTIFLTLKECKGDKDSMISMLFQQLNEVYENFFSIWTNVTDLRLGSKMNKMHSMISQFDVIDKYKMNYVKMALKFLSQALYMYYEKQVVILIDEYDTPFIEAYTHGYYDEVKGFLSSLLSNALKGNDYLKFAVITGIQRVAKEGLFSGLNNLEVYTMEDKMFADVFGFTEEETEKLLQYYGLELTEDVKDMYDGYKFGDKDIYNPWSILNYAKRGELKPYWVNTSSNDWLEKLIENDKEFQEEYNKLVKQEKPIVEIDMNASYGEINVWTMLLNAGYLNIIEQISDGTYRIDFVNDEIRSTFMKRIGNYLRVPNKQLHTIIYALIKEDMDTFINTYRELLVQLPSYHDLKDENSYHMLLLGLCASLYQSYDVLSNREQGIGRSDIFLRAKNKGNKNIVLELKYTKDGREDLHKLAEKALNQIKERYVDQKMFMVGIAHCGKQCEVAYVYSK